MQVETTLFFESLEQIYRRVFQTAKPGTEIPRISIRFRKFANANSRVKFHDGQLSVEISDLLEAAPAPIHEALAIILLTKLCGKKPGEAVSARYRRYLNRGDVRQALEAIRQERGRKIVRHPKGKYHDLRRIFDDLNFQYFRGLMAPPELGWSVRPSKTTLGHYDPSHNTIVLSSLLDSPLASDLIVRYVTFHEMLHIRFPTQHRGAKRCVHTKEFKTAERLFANFEVARKNLRRFVELSRRRGGTEVQRGTGAALA